jgi:hypothetical protein
MVKKILLTLVVLIVAFAVVVALQPSTFRIERSASIVAPPDVVFGLVNDFHKWEAWSPWAKLDPNAKNSFEGPESGTGAIFKWAGNKDVGEGSMTLTDSKPNEKIQIRLDFVKPFKDTSTAEFTFKPDGSQTIVTWSMFGENNFISKAFCLFMDMDEMVGGQFEQGLAAMKVAAEGQPLQPL